MPDISGLDVCRFRQLTAFWRLQGLWTALRGTQRQWGVMTREGLDRVSGVTGR